MVRRLERCGDVCAAGWRAPVAFHLRHMARSLDRLLTYAEDGSWMSAQLAALRTEMEPGTAAAGWEISAGHCSAREAGAAFAPESFGEARGIGRKRLPTTVAGLLVHCAEHTQRHVGQMVTTVKVVTAEANRQP